MFPTHIEECRLFIVCCTVCMFVFISLSPLPVLFQELFTPSSLIVVYLFCQKGWSVTTFISENNRQTHRFRLVKPIFFKMCYSLVTVVY